jgi:hypothetical protein
MLEWGGLIVKHLRILIKGSMAKKKNTQAEPAYGILYKKCPS